MNLCNHAWTVDRTPPGGELDLTAFRRKDTVYDIGHYRCMELARKVAGLPFLGWL